MREPNRILTARDLMTTSLITFRPDQSLFDAMGVLLKHSISGAPVLDEDGRMVGILSELDCLRTFASDEFYQEDQEEGACVGQVMTSCGRNIPPDLGIYAIAHYFVTGPIRRLPVVEREKLIGQVSRRDVLRGMQQMSQKRLTRRRYPDYREPA